MDNLGILDLVIGLFFIFFVFSVICTAIVEGIAQMKDLRSTHLRKWVTDTFAEKFGKELLSHGLIKGLTQKSRNADYIPANVFSAALLDLVYAKFRSDKRINKEDQLPPAYDFDRLEAAMLSPGNPLPEDMTRYLLQAIEESKNSAGSLMLIKKQLEDWYAEAMERVIGTYKKRARVITFIVAALVTLVTNADTIALCKYLKDNPQTTAKLVAAAEQATRDSVYYKQTIESLKIIDSKFAATPTGTKTDSVLQNDIKETISKLKEKEVLINDLYSSLNKIGLPLGWEKSFPPTYQGERERVDWAEIWYYTKWGFQKIIGLLLTTLALTLGAPFWFDMINKLVNIRSGGKKPEDTPTPDNKTTPAG